MDAVGKLRGKSLSAPVENTEQAGNRALAVISHTWFGLTEDHGGEKPWNPVDLLLQVRKGSSSGAIKEHGEMC